MLFRDAPQRDHAIHLLLRLDDAGDAWSRTGPEVTPGVPRTASQSLLIGVGFTLARAGYGDQHRLRDVLDLDPGIQTALFELVLAMLDGHAAIDRWIRANDLALRGTALVDLRTDDYAGWFRGVLQGVQRASSKEDAARLLGVSKSTFYRWLADDHVLGHHPDVLALCVRARQPRMPVQRPEPR